MTNREVIRLVAEGAAAGRFSAETSFDGMRFGVALSFDHDCVAIPRSHTLRAIRMNHNPDKKTADEFFAELTEGIPSSVLDQPFRDDISPPLREAVEHARMMNRPL